MKVKAETACSNDLNEATVNVSVEVKTLRVICNQSGIVCVEVVILDITVVVVVYMLDELVEVEILKIDVPVNTGVPVVTVLTEIVSKRLVSTVDVVLVTF